MAKERQVWRSCWTETCVYLLMTSALLSVSADCAVVYRALEGNVTFDFNFSNETFLEFYACLTNGTFAKCTAECNNCTTECINSSCSINSIKSEGTIKTSAHTYSCSTDVKDIRTLECKCLQLEDTCSVRKYHLRLNNLDCSRSAIFFLKNEEDLLYAQGFLSACASNDSSIQTCSMADSLNKEALIIGVVVGVIFIAIIIVVFGIFLWKRKKFQPKTESMSHDASLRKNVGQKSSNDFQKSSDNVKTKSFMGYMEIDDPHCPISHKINTDTVIKFTVKNSHLTGVSQTGTNRTYNNCSTSNDKLKNPMYSEEMSTDLLDDILPDYSKIANSANAVAKPLKNTSDSSGSKFSPGLSSPGHIYNRLGERIIERTHEYEPYVYPQDDQHHNRRPLASTKAQNNSNEMSSHSSTDTSEIHISDTVKSTTPRDARQFTFKDSNQQIKYTNMDPADCITLPFHVAVKTSPETEEPKRIYFEVEKIKDNEI